MQVEIRPLKIDDAKISYKWRNNPVVWKYTGSKPDKFITEEIETKWLSEVLQRKNEKRYAIVVDNIYVGNTQLLNITEDDAVFHIFIGNTNYWGKGVGNIALQLVIEDAKKNKLKKLKLEVNKNNIPAYSIYKKNGFLLKKEINNNVIQMELNLDE